MDLLVSIPSEEWKLQMNAPDVVFQYKGVDFNYNLAEWKSALSFGDIYLRIYYKEKKANVVELEVNNTCFSTIYNEVNKSYNHNYSEETDSLFKYKKFTSDKDDFIFVFSESTEGKQKYRILCYNKADIDSVIYRIRMEEQRKLEEQRAKIASINSAISTSDSLHALEQTDHAIEHIEKHLNILPEYDITLSAKINEYREGRMQRKIKMLEQEGDVFFKRASG